ncbi:GTP pyrophosphokinase [Candidatus Pantoea rara]|uniref:GTP pyrophosphokinase n=1 Tax=Candidatus Pantoea rara TaxID=1947037 RepID=UPI003EBF39CF
MNDLGLEFERKKPIYKKLKKGIVSELTEVLEQNSISLFNLESRVKDTQSFIDKVTRKGYQNPFTEVEDICGVRLIAYYASDLDKIHEIIHDEFNVISDSDKQSEAAEDRFGYASRHYIIEIKKEWLNAPSFRGVQGFKAEIQVRTILMHSWAAISHKLLYKRESDVPKPIKRKLHRLSALIELADEQFETIKNAKKFYNEEVMKKEDNEKKNIELNVDNLMSLVEKYSPGREVYYQGMHDFLEEIKPLNISLWDMEQFIIKALPVIDSFEASEVEKNDYEDHQLWNSLGYCRTVLNLTHDEYFEKFRKSIPSNFEDIVENTEVYRKRLK